MNDQPPPSATGLLSQTASAPANTETSPSQPTPSSPSSTQPPQRLTPTEQLDRIAGLMAGQQPLEQADVDDAGGDRAGPVAGDDGGDPAEPLDAPRKTIYDEEVSLGDGEKVTVGALKDAYQTRQAAERESAKRSVALDIRESEVAQEQRFWMELGEMPAPVKQRIAAKLQATERIEHGKMLQMMPEMRDKSTFDTFRTGVVEALAKYGYSPQQIVITDHRQLMILRDLMRANARIAALTAEPKPAGPKAKPDDRRGSPQQARPRNQAEAIAQIAKLMR